MDEYRPTLLGRALADVLQDLERGGAIAERDSDALFAIFDDVMRSEFAAAERKPAAQAPAAPPPPLPLFTHRTMDLQGSAQSFNRFMDKWVVEASLDTASGESLRLEGVPVDLHMAHMPHVPMVVKLHDLPKQAPAKKRRK